MKKIILLTLICLCMCVYTGISWATVIDFEYFASSDMAHIPYGFYGFSWSAYAWYMGHPQIIQHPHTGYVYGTIGDANMFTAYEYDVSMTKISGDFDLDGAYITSAWNQTQQVTVEGWHSGSIIYTQTITTHNDMPYWFDFDYSDIDTVWFRPHPSPGSFGSQIVMDNITYEETVIPEPASFLLFGVGGLAMALIRRKRRF